MKPQYAVPLIAALLYRAYSRKSLTPVGLIVAAFTATAHALHPWSFGFVLLAVFFLGASSATKVKHAQKSSYTTSVPASKSSSNQDAAFSTHPPPRGAVQVLCNSLPATILLLAHTYLLSEYSPLISQQGSSASQAASACLPWPIPSLLPAAAAQKAAWSNQAAWTLANFRDALPYGVLDHYAAVSADTYSSELGILSSSSTILITDILGLLTFRPRIVPRGTNGGVTWLGILAGAGGAATIAVASLVALPFCEGLESWTINRRLALAATVLVFGVVGSLLDSILGALLQASVVEIKSGKIVEGEIGAKVTFGPASSDHKGSGSYSKTQNSMARKLLVGNDILSNNGVNLLMCSIMALAGIYCALLLRSN